MLSCRPSSFALIHKPLVHCHCNYYWTKHVHKLKPKQPKQSMKANHCTKPESKPEVSTTSPFTSLDQSHVQSNISYFQLNLFTSYTHLFYLLFTSVTIIPRWLTTTFLYDIFLYYTIHFFSGGVADFRAWSWLVTHRLSWLIHTFGRKSQDSLGKVIYSQLVKIFD